MIVLTPDFMTKIGKKAAQDCLCAVSKVFDKSENRSPMVRKKIKIKKTIKGYGSAASVALATKLSMRNTVETRISTEQQKPNKNGCQ